MAFANRLRSSLPLQVLVSKVLRSEPVSAAAQRAVVCPTLSKTKVGQTKNNKEEKVKLPLVLFGGYGKYASALYIAAVKTDSLDKVESEILDFVQSIKNTPELSQFTKDPTVPARSRVKAMAEISSQFEHSETTKSFLAVLAEHGGLNHVEAIAKKFVELTMAHKGIVEVNVTSVIASKTASLLPGLAGDNFSGRIEAHTMIDQGWPENLSPASPGRREAVLKACVVVRKGEKPSPA
ncbi:hypothetical protein ACLB2K_044182 [Fragaria x ananassa]